MATQNAITVAAFFPDNDEEIVRVHDASCTHTLRDWRSYGTPVMLYVESGKAIVRQLSRNGIRFKGVRVMPCARIPEGYWSHTPTGARMKLHGTRTGALNATRRIRKIDAESNHFGTPVLADYMSARYGFKVVSK